VQKWRKKWGGGERQTVSMSSLLRDGSITLTGKEVNHWFPRGLLRGEKYAKGVGSEYGSGYNGGARGKEIIKQSSL